MDDSILQVLSPFQATVPCSQPGITNFSVIPTQDPVQINTLGPCSQSNTDLSIISIQNPQQNDNIKVQNLDPTLTWPGWLLRYHLTLPGYYHSLKNQFVIGRKSMQRHSNKLLMCAIKMEIIASFAKPWSLPFTIFITKTMLAMQYQHHNMVLPVVARPTYPSEVRLVPAAERT